MSALFIPIIYSFGTRPSCHLLFARSLLFRPEVSCAPPVYISYIQLRRPALVLLTSFLRLPYLYIAPRIGLFRAGGPFSPPPGRGRIPRFDLLNLVRAACRVASNMDATRGGVRNRGAAHACIDLYMLARCSVHVQSVMISWGFSSRRFVHVYTQCCFRCIVAQAKEAPTHLRFQCLFKRAATNTHRRNTNTQYTNKHTQHNSFFKQP